MVSPLLRLKSYSEPLMLLGISLIFFPITLLAHPLLILTSPSTFRSKWFENFWKYASLVVFVAEISAELSPGSINLLTLK